jgi:monoamine oxidase
VTGVPEGSRPKVVVVGGGFAGLAAAVALQERGHEVQIIEGRDRLGGRTLTAPWLGDGPPVEYGGASFMPEHRRVRRELERAGSEVRENLPTEWRWRTGGQIRLGLPVARDEWPAFEAALRRLAADADALAGGDTDAASLSFADYLRRLTGSQSVRDFLLGWWAITGGSDPSEGAAVNALGSISGHGGLLGVPETLRRMPSLGWAAIAESMATCSRAQVRYSQAVARVQWGEEITLCLDTGERVVADAAILALPLNVLAAIDFDPPLPERLRSSLGKNRGRALKLWMSTRGIPPRSLAAGAGQGLNLLLHDGMVGSDGLVVGFGPASPRFDPTDRDAVLVALRAFYPDAELVSFDHHDWIGDPFARGTWANDPAGEIGVRDPARFAPLRRLAFASSDFAPEFAGWIEGAMESGELAGGAIADALSRTPATTSAPLSGDPLSG